MGNYTKPGTAAELGRSTPAPGPLAPVPREPSGRRSCARTSIGTASLLGLQARRNPREPGRVQGSAGREPRQAGQGIAECTDERRCRLALSLAGGGAGWLCSARPEPRSRQSCRLPLARALRVPAPGKAGPLGARAADAGPAGGSARGKPRPSPSAAAERAGSSQGLGGGGGVWPQLLLLLHLPAPSICRGYGPSLEHKRVSAAGVGVALAFPRWGVR